MGPVSKTIAFILAAVLAASSSQTSADQSRLPMTINDGFDGRDRLLKFDWPILSIGTGQYEDGPTGLTVFRFARPVYVAMDARGGGPGTINSDYVRLGYPVPTLDAIVFAGGSWYGLEAATAVNSAMKDDGYRSGSWDNVGLTLGSIIYDFGPRRLNEIYPDKRLAQAAYRAARTGVFPLGPYGAGRSAVSGGMFGCNAKSGQGAAWRQVGSIKVATFVVVNALGVVTDRDGKVASCNADPAWPRPLTTTYLMQSALRPSTAERRNTTISLAVTNVKLNPAELERFAIQVHQSMARGIQPFATEADGDVLYAVSTGEIDYPGEGPASPQLGMMASELMWDAILASVPSEAQRAMAAGTERGSAARPGIYRFSDRVSLAVTARGGEIWGEAQGDRNIGLLQRSAPQRLERLENGDYSVAGRYPTRFRFIGGRVIFNAGRWQQVGTRGKR